jgi:hypothetical protein
MAWRCPDCGIYKAGLYKPASHTCDIERYVTYQVRLFDTAYRHFLSSTQGRFYTYYAKRLIRQGLSQPD